jgi:hypothetical protein
VSKAITVFDKWLPEIENDSLTIDATPTGINKEARNNLWTFSVTEKEAQTLDKNDIVSFLVDVAKLRDQQLRLLGVEAGAITYYCWVDEQARQLRFSFVSSSHSILPFGGAIALADDLGTIADQFLDAPYKEGIPWCELTPAPIGDEDGSDIELSNADIGPVLVWKTTLPSDAVTSPLKAPQ